MNTCNVSFQVDGPISLTKAILFGQICGKEAPFTCAHCGKSRCARHITTCSQCGGHVCDTDQYSCADDNRCNAELCSRGRRSEIRTDNGGASAGNSAISAARPKPDKPPLPLHDLHRHGGAINELNSDLGRALQGVEVTLQGGDARDIVTAVTRLDNSKQVKTILIDAIRQISNELGYENLRYQDWTPQLNSSILRRLRPRLMEMGFDPAGPVQFVMSGPRTPSCRSDAEAFRLAAESGGAHDQYLYGRILQEGRGILANPSEAAKWYRKAAECGHAHAQYQLALLYDHGIGEFQDQVKARAWYGAAAKQGDSDAEANLGYMYLNGEGGSVDLPRAIAMLNSAAKKGNLTATGTLATCYDNGKGVTKDAAKAFELYMRVASSTESHPSVAGAQYNVGIAYLNGDGISRDVMKAVSWFQRAAARGHARSRQVLDSLRR